MHCIPETLHMFCKMSAALLCFFTRRFITAQIFVEEYSLLFPTAYAWTCTISCISPRHRHELIQKLGPIHIPRSCTLAARLIESQTTCVRGLYWTLDLTISGVVDGAGVQTTGRTFSGGTSGQQECFSDNLTLKKFFNVQTIFFKFQNLKNKLNPICSFDRLNLDSDDHWPC